MDLKKHALDIFSAAVRAADPYERVKQAVRPDDGGIMIDDEYYPRDRYDTIVVVGAGKASARMGLAVEDVLGDRIAGGWINTKYDHGIPLRRIHVHECGHPVPDDKGLAGTEHIIELLEKADERTLIICVLSGGGSALTPAPAEGISLAEKQDVTRRLLTAGASIGELNAVRKHLSRIKGGGMARLSSPARLHVLILSDVIGDRLDTIASGPAVADPSTFGTCIDIMERYGLVDSIPVNVLNRLEDGRAGRIPETAKPGDDFLDSARNSIVGNNGLSVDAAADRAKELGYNPLVLTTVLDGEAREMGNMFAAVAKELQSTGRPVRPPACILAGGETTVTVRGNGKGGRNQEMALAAAVRLSGMEGVAFLSGGTDGTDGPTDAAGGVVDGGTAAQAGERGLDIHGHLNRNDSYPCLDGVGCLVKTGPTGTNVMDIQVLLAVGKTPPGNGKHT